MTLGTSPFSRKSQNRRSEAAFIHPWEGQAVVLPLQSDLVGISSSSCRYLAEYSLPHSCSSTCQDRPHVHSQQDSKICLEEALGGGTAGVFGENVKGQQPEVFHGWQLLARQTR